MSDASLRAAQRAALVDGPEAGARALVALVRAGQAPEYLRMLAGDYACHSCGCDPAVTWYHDSAAGEPYCAVCLLAAGEWVSALAPWASSDARGRACVQCASCHEVVRRWTTWRRRGVTGLWCARCRDSDVAAEHLLAELDA